MTTTATAVLRCGLYLRISSDRDDSELGVKRQEKEGRALIRRKGWAVADVYIDNDTSADVGVTRPAYQRMLEDARSGRLDAICGWSVDRLTRQPRECEDLIELNEKHSVQLATVGGEIDISTGMGQLCLRILVAYANSELKTRRARQISERRQNAEAGKIHSGGMRPFGYLSDKRTVDQSEAVHIREAARRVLSGESLRSICIDFERRGIRGTTGAPMKMATLKQMLCSARISGRRSLYQGPKGSPRPALSQIVSDVTEWEGIISVEDSDALRSILTQSSRRTNTTTARRYLLPGFIRCETCERPMQSHRSGTNSPRSYACSTADPGVKCRKQVNAEGAEGEVVSRVLSQLQSPKYLNMLHDRLGVDRSVVEQLARDLEERDEIAREKARGDLSPSEWRAQREVLTERIERAQTLIEKQTRSAALKQLLDDDGTTIHERWEGLTLDQRRDVLRIVVDEVVVKPGGAGKRFDGKRIAVSWAA